MKLSLSPISVEILSTAYISSRSVEDVRLNVPIVANQDHPREEGGGLCWAACIAAIGAYKNNTAPKTALDVYNWLNDNCVALNALYQYPTGIAPYEEKALQDMFGLDYELEFGGLAFSDIQVFIQKDIPIFACLSCSVHDNCGHGVVISAYQKFPGACMLKLMDPNEESYVAVYMDSDAKEFTYVIDNHSLSGWVRRYHEILYYEDL